MRALLVVLTLVVALPIRAGEKSEPAGAPASRLSPQGRFLYANDDDWDWASPKGKQTTRLSEYGIMDWSALDWIEEGLQEVRGLVVGTLPVDHLGADKLDVARGRAEKSTYVREAPARTLLARRLAPDAKEAFNVLLMMRNSCNDPAPAFDKEDLEALAAFVQRGGRVIVLDDGGDYREILERMLRGRPAGEVVAPPPKPEPLQEKVAGMVKLLGNDNWEIREKATKNLIALGPEILPVIEATKSDDPEVRQRLEMVAAAFRVRQPEPRATMNSLTNDQMDVFLPRARKAAGSAEMRAIKRNAQQEPGRALLMEFPEPKPKG